MNDLPTVYALISPDGFLWGTYRNLGAAKSARTQMNHPELKVVQYVANQEIS